VKALKAVVGGLQRRPGGPVRVPGLQDPPATPSDSLVRAERQLPSAPSASANTVGRLPSAGAGVAGVGAASGTPVGRLPSAGAVSASGHEFTRIERSWRWQQGFHDHKFRTPESESRKWEYVCLNPIRARLVERPEQWPYTGEIFYDETAGPRVIRGTPPLLQNGMLIEENEPPRHGIAPIT
jgi:hypothetical protein